MKCYLTKNCKKLFFTFLFFVSIANVNSQNRDYTLYIFLLDNCKISQSYSLKINELYKEYNDIVDFVGVFPNRISTEDNIEAHMQKYKHEFSFITDYDKELALSLNATITPEVFLLENKTDEILYSGRIDNEFVQVGRRRNVVTEEELSVALKSIREGNEIKIKSTEAIGCFINFFDTQN